MVFRAEWYSSYDDKWYRLGVERVSTSREAAFNYAAQLPNGTEFKMYKTGQAATRWKVSKNGVAYRT